MDKQISLKDIIDFLNADIKQVFGNTQNIFINNLNPSEAVNKDTLDWINPAKANKQFIAENTRARVVIVGEGIIYSPELKEQRKIIIVVNNPKLAIAMLGHEFFVDKIKPQIHPTAVIHPEADIGNRVFIGANCTVGKCKIGTRSIINSKVVINDDVVIGSEVIIKPGAVIGFDGFGYERDLNGNFFKFPQLGKLIIHDKVEIGSNTCIDKGALSDTIIGFNSKINNLCHIAHNVIIGSNVIVTAHVNISGSTIIEDDVWIAPNVSLRSHQKIGKGATIGMGAVVTKDVPAGETWVGNPARKI